MDFTKAHTLKPKGVFEQPFKTHHFIIMLANLIKDASRVIYE